MALVNINTLNAASITGEVTIKLYRDNIPFEITMTQFKEYIGGDTSIINDNDKVLYVNKSTGRGTRILVLQLKEYIEQNLHLNGSSLLPVYLNGVPKRASVSAVKIFVNSIGSFFYNPIMTIEQNGFN